MVILRIALILVCVFSLSWSVLIFGGPSIIKRLIVSYSDGTVIPSNISVSPTLGINIGRLDYIIGNNFFATPIDGFSRSTEISWSLFDDRPFMYGRLPKLLLAWMFGMNLWAGYYIYHKHSAAQHL